MCSLSRVQLFLTPWTVSCQATLSLEFSSKENWGGSPVPSPGDLPDPGNASPALAVRFFTTELSGVCLTTIEKKKRKQNKTICAELINIYFRVLKGNR